MLLVFPKSYAEVRCELVLSDEANSRWEWKPAEGLLRGLRSNVHHFWEWSAANKDLLDSKLLSFKGWVLGDAHLFNFAEVRLKDGSYKWSFNDLDDSGIGPFILDLMRFAITVKASNYKTVSFEDLYEAYVDGVTGNAYSKPDIIKELREISEKDAENEWTDFIKKIIDFDTEKINYGIKSIISFFEGPKPLQNFVTEHLDQFKSFLAKGSVIKDLAFRIKVSGGSQGIPRVYIAAKVEDNEFIIYEFKPLVRPALDYYQKQSNNESRINNMMKWLWKDSIPTDYRYVKVEDREFFMRIRLPKLFELHDEEEFLALSAKEQKEYLLYIANWMGKKHSEQIANFVEYGEELNKPATVGQLEKFLVQYLAEAERLNSRP
jgi:hypothetical protein